MNFSTYLGNRARLLKNRNYLIFILNCLLAPFGNGFVYIALSWHTQSHSSSPGGVALLMLCLWGPTVLLAPVAGWLVDFGSPRMVALLSNLGRGLLMILLAFLINQWKESQWISIYCVSLLLGTLSSLYVPAALTLIRGLVPEKDLLYANSTVDIVIETGSIVGMGLAGIFLAWFGVGLSMITGGICFALAGLCFLFVRAGYKATKEESPVKESVTRSLQQSWLILKKSKSLRTTYLMQAILLMMLMTVPVLLAPYALESRCR